MLDYTIPQEIPHCPNSQCVCYHDPPKKAWYKAHATYTTNTKGLITRYRCCYCGKTFSAQTFSIDYYVKKNVDYHFLLYNLKTASGLIDVYREKRYSVETIQNRYERLARCALAIHSRILGQVPMLEDFAADGLESFAYSQYFPNNINIIAGSNSEFIYTLGFANLRRKGKMTEKQRLHRAKLEKAAKADPKAIEKSMKSLILELLSYLVAKNSCAKSFHTDQHKQYEQAIAAIPEFADKLTHVQTSSKRKRDKRNPLFPVNYVDRQIRKDCSDHVRETVQFAKCPSALMSRMELYKFMHNYEIPHRVKDLRQGDDSTHAEMTGLGRSAITEGVKAYWMKRPFLKKISLGDEAQKTWFMQWLNPGKKMGRYVPKFIAA